jgi:hypothetical protein
LSGVNFFTATLINADLSDAELVEADLRGVNATGANLTRADLPISRGRYSSEPISAMLGSTGPNYEVRGSQAQISPLRNWWALTCVERCTLRRSGATPLDCLKAFSRNSTG